MDLGGLRNIVSELTKSAEERAVARALKLYSKGELGKAIDALKEAQKRSPEDPGVLMELGRLLGMAGRGAEGAEALRGVLRHDPKAVQRVGEVIEEVRARSAQGGALYDALVEHYVRHDDFKAAFRTLEQMKPEEIKAAVHRHQGKWESLLKGAPGAKLARASLHSAYHLALACEALREFDRAAEIYRKVAGTNPEEIDRLLPRLEALAAREYKNTALRLALANLLIKAGRPAEAARQYALALQTDARAAAPVAEKLHAYLNEKGDQPDLRLVLAQALLAAGDVVSALPALRPLVESGAHLDQVAAHLETLAAAEKGGPARRLLATAHTRRGRPQQALEMLLQLAEEEGLASIEEPLQTLAEATPDSARVQNLLADVHLAAKRAGQAVECLRKARDLAPGDATMLLSKLGKVLEINRTEPGAHLLLADLLEGTGEVERVIVLLRHLVRESPASAAEALTRLAQTAAREGERAPRAAIGTAECCLALGRFPDALAHLKAVALAHPDLAPEFLHPLGLLAEEAPALGGAIADLLRPLEPRCPVPLAARYARAQATLAGGDPAAAAALFRDVLRDAPERAEEVRQALLRFDRDDPRAAEARYLLAMLDIDRGDHAAALAELSRGGSTNAALLDRVLAKYAEIIARSPGDVAARGGFVRALLLRGDFDRAIAIGEETLKIKDDASTARVSLALGEALAGKGDADGAAERFFAAYRRDAALLDEAAGRLKRLAALEGTHQLASLLLGKLLAAQGRAAEAVEAFRAARAADPQQRETVLTELRALMASCPGDPQAALWTIAILMEKGEVRKAIQVVSTQLDAHPALAAVLAGHLERILAAAPKEPFALYEMGRAQQRLKNHGRGATCYLAAFRLDASLAPMILKRLKEIEEAAPTCIEGYLAACSIHAARGKPLAAAEALKQATKKIPSAADRILPRLEEIWNEDRGNVHVGMIFADASLRAGGHAKALLAYDEAARRDLALLDAAFEGFDAIVKACPKMGEAYLARGRAHGLRMRVEEAIADLSRASRLDPRLLPAVSEALEGLRKRHPESAACAMLLADLYLAAGKAEQAGRLLEEEDRRGREPAHRLSVLMRLWWLAGTRRDRAAARRYLEQAERLSPDRKRFLQHIHQLHVNAVRAEVARLTKALHEGSPRPADREAAVRLLLDLGDTEEAQGLLGEAPGGPARPEVLRLQAEIALRKGEFARASSLFSSLGPSRALAFGASRAGDYALAIQTLERLVERDADQDLKTSLARLYREMVAADLLGAGRRLLAETAVSFGEGAAA